MSSQPPSPTSPSVDLNKAWGAGGSAALGAVVARLVAHILNAKWPGLIDAETLGDLTTLFVVGPAFAGAYFTPHRA